MTLETNFNALIERILTNGSTYLISNKQLIQSVDLTLLDENASPESINQIVHQASTIDIAALCVYMKHLHYFNQGSGYNVATVINFPQGSNEVSQCINDIKQAAHLGANEIDYVLPYPLYLGGSKQSALNQCSLVAEQCKTHNLTLKIIIETGAFPDMTSIYQVSAELIKIGCDFLKTSTGKIQQGASLSAAFAILSAIKDSGQNCGLKVSGQVKTEQQARNYAILSESIIGKNISKDWFRIGASGLLNELI